MLRILNSFRQRDEGGTSIDWVALTAGILLLGISVVYGVFSGGLTGLTTHINATMSGGIAAPVTVAPGQRDFQ